MKLCIALPLLFAVHARMSSAQPEPVRGTRRWQGKARVAIGGARACDWMAPSLLSRLTPSCVVPPASSSSPPPARLAGPLLRGGPQAVAELITLLIRCDVNRVKRPLGRAASAGRTSSGSAGTSRPTRASATTACAPRPAITPPWRADDCAPPFSHKRLACKGAPIFHGPVYKLKLGHAH